MFRTSLFIALAALGFTAADASAEEVQVSYTGVVTQASGPHAASFVAGQTITVRYVVETATVDNNPSASAGVFFGGLRELQITVPDAGVNVVTGTGTVQTFNDLPNPTSPTDQAFFYGTATSGTLAGLPVGHSEVDFIDNETVGDGTVAMLASDAVPASRLLTTDSFISLGTNSGYTYVHFLMEADEPVATCASEGFTGTKLAWCRKICESGYTGAQLDMWIRRWTDRYRALPACALTPSET